MPDGLDLTRETLVGLLCAAAGLDRLPAQHWPVDAALQYLERHVVKDSAVARTLARWPRPHTDPSFQYGELPALTRKLVSLGLLAPEGTSWEASFRVEASWAAKNRALFIRLPATEQRSLRRAGQRLVALATMASKKPVAAVVSSEPAI
jgi:hypothetical protein